MAKLKTLLHDWVRVRMDPVAREDVSTGGIILTTPVMVRTGIVQDTGPGKRWSPKKFTRMQVEIGERVVFYAGNMDTKQGQMLSSYVDEDEALLPETSILFVLELDEGEAIPRVEK